ncbi:ATP-binding protein, partial [Cohnella sp.]|uniref:ATP-binding protein n=1 Tax=Cohnella sp. TaxID=1883426 RepID=UPI003567407A
MVAILKDLVLNFAISGVFLFLVSPLFIRGRTRRTNKLVHQLIIGGVFGILGIVLTVFGIDINGSAQLNLQGIALMLAAYFAGPAGALSELAVVFSWRLAANGYLDAAQVGIGVAAAVGTGLLFQKVNSYFLKWLSGALFLFYFYYVGLWITGQISWGALKYDCVYQAGFTALVSVFLYYLERNEANRSKAIQAERDMSSMLRMQPGLTFRFQKRGDKYYYTMIEGRLLQRIGAAPEDFIGRSVDEVDFFPRDYIELLNRQYDEAWEGEEVSHERLFNDLILHINLHPIRTDGAVSEVIGTGIDITEEKRRQEADESNKAKSRFLAQMSHEIRTPINAIIGLNYILQQSDLNEKQLDYVNKSITAAKSLLAIVNDVLDFSKIEANKVVLENIEFDLYEVLHNLSNMVSFKAYEKGLKFRFSIDPQVPQMLIGDPYRLQQILLNVTNNAVKFTNSGELAISVHCGEQAHGMTQVKFVVRDTGIGMTKEQLEGLFREFTQGDMTTTRRFGGTGLGLVISKRLAELMGGTIQADSRPGQGSTFEISLPLASADASVYGEEFDQALSFVRVLLVCSDLQMQWVLRRQLSQFKFVVNLANGAVDALDKLDRGESYDMVIVDWKLKGEDPLTLAQAIRGRGVSEQPSVVLVSSYHESELQQALQSGYVSRA